MPYSFTEKKRIRKNFGRLEEPMAFPNLLSIQLDSYERFLQKDVKPENREVVGLQAAFRSVLPVYSNNEWAGLDFVSYELREPRFSFDECLHRGKTYAVPLHVTLRLALYDREKPAKDTMASAIEQDVYVGEIPMMTPNGTFIINGTERVVVSQLHRSPGVYFLNDQGKTYANRTVFSARVIPQVGSWLDFELGFDTKEQREHRQKQRKEREVEAKQSRGREINAQNSRFVREFETWLRNNGRNTSDIVDRYLGTDEITLGANGFELDFRDPERYVDLEAPMDLLDASGKVILEEGKPITLKVAQRLARESIEQLRLPVPDEFLLNRQVAEDVLSSDKGQPIVRAHATLDENFIDRIREEKVQSFKLIRLQWRHFDRVLALGVGDVRGTSLLDTPDGLRQRQQRYLTAFGELIAKADRTIGDAFDEALLTDTYRLEEDRAVLQIVNPERLVGQIARVDVKSPSADRAIVRTGKRITAYHASRMKKVDEVELPDSEVCELVLATAITHPQSGESIAQVGEIVTPTLLGQLRDAKVGTFETVFIDENSDTQLTEYALSLDIQKRTVTRFKSVNGNLPAFSEETEEEFKTRSGQIDNQEKLHELYAGVIEEAIGTDDSRDGTLARLYDEFVQKINQIELVVASKQKSKTDKEQKEYVFVRIDRKKKLHVTHLLRGLGMTDQEVLDEFFEADQYRVLSNGDIEFEILDPNALLGETAKVNIPTSGDPIVRQGERINKRHVDLISALPANKRRLNVPDEYFEGNVLAKDILDPDKGDVLFHCNHLLQADDVARLRTRQIEGFATIATNELRHGSYIADTLRRDPDHEPSNTKQRSLYEIYSVMRPGEPITQDSAEALFERTFFSQERYELSDVGRMKFNRRLGWEEERLIGLLSSSKEVKVRDRVVVREGQRLTVKHLEQLRKTDEVVEIDVNLALRNIDRDAQRDMYIRGLVAASTVQDVDGNVLIRTGDAIYGVKLSRLLETRLAEIPAKLKVDISTNVLDKYDILGVLKKLLQVVHGLDDIDDIDSLANRRVRSVGELAEISFKQGLRRVDRAIKDRLVNAASDNLMPQDLINTKPIASAVKEFFAGHELSQFMEQNNPLSEVTHKRKVSALGPGGLTREHAGFEVRDVHWSHYGRICPIETPEGANIGLISSLGIHARTNKHGFIASPYRLVEKGVVTNKVEYLSAMDESHYPIAQANAPLTDGNTFVDERVDVRVDGEFTKSRADDVRYMDVSPKQIVSISAALIPFLEHDEANRCLMGSNQQRQAVPTIKVEAPLVGTGVESYVARDAGVCITARRPGTVALVDAKRIVIRVSQQASERTVSDEIDIYELIKYQRTNQDTCINHRPVVKLGDQVGVNDVLADGPSIDLGELALGQNIRIAFMVWNGYNYQDAILVSERVVQEDRFTSVHILEEVCSARETKIGNEEVTRDIPNVSDSALSQLDDTGIVHIGAEVKEGDILVGKVTPREESTATGEEKLLRAIFGNKADDVKDSSLRVPPGVHGTVIDVQIFYREGQEKNERAMDIDNDSLFSFQHDQQDQERIIRRTKFANLRDAMVGLPVATAPGLEAGAVITEEYLEELNHDDWYDIRMEQDDLNKRIDRVKRDLDKLRDEQYRKLEEKEQKLQAGSDLHPGVLCEVKVYLATKKHIQAGDKMAGRHGNKGVISVIMPVEDMPFDENGEPIDIVLNPLGVPSRMNVGQVLETQLGWAAKGIGDKIGVMIDQQESIANLREYITEIYNSLDGLQEEISDLTDAEVVELAGNLRHGLPVSTPIFDGARESDVEQMLEKAGLPTDGQTTLFDGRTGNAFDRKVTVGYMYMLKLNHLVDDKMHARSTGSYSMVTQQPLGGKARLGGQRFGEMEVWALEAYGAAHTLQEMLTIKSDDLEGRAEIYRRLVDGRFHIKPGIPESFQVIRKEIRALGLNLDMESV